METCTVCGNVTENFYLRGLDEVMCDECCGVYDREIMDIFGEITMFVWMNRRLVGHYPGISFPIMDYRYGSHNLMGRRLDIWFIVGNSVWHGVSLGNSQIARCKRTKLTI